MRSLVDVLREVHPETLVHIQRLRDRRAPELELAVRCKVLDVGFPATVGEEDLGGELVHQRTRVKPKNPSIVGVEAPAGPWRPLEELVCFGCSKRLEKRPCKALGGPSLGGPWEAPDRPVLGFGFCVLGFVFCVLGFVF